MKMLAVFAIAAAAASPALADWPEPTPEQIAKFQAADANGDGRVDLAEAQTVWPDLTEREMKVHDATPDGALDLYEFQTVRNATPVRSPGD